MWALILVLSMVSPTEDEKLSRGDFALVKKLPPANDDNPKPPGEGWQWDRERKVWWRYVN